MNVWETFKGVNREADEMKGGRVGRCQFNILENDSREQRDECLGDIQESEPRSGYLLIHFSKVFLIRPRVKYLDRRLAIFRYFLLKSHLCID